MREEETAELIILNAAEIVMLVPLWGKVHLKIKVQVHTVCGMCVLYKIYYSACIHIR